MRVESGKTIKKEGYYLLKKAAAPKPVDVNEAVTIKLSETDTVFVLDLPSLVVSFDHAEEYQNVKTANERYSKVILSSSSLPSLIS